MKILTRLIFSLLVSLAIMLPVSHAQMQVLNDEELREIQAQNRITHVVIDVLTLVRWIQDGACNRYRCTGPGAGH